MTGARPLGRRLRRLAPDRRGVTAVEFALITPALLMAVMGLMDMAYQAYAQAVLEGAVQKAGRDSGIESASPSTIDGKVAAQIRAVIANAQVTTTRKSYTSFGTVAPERFTDANNNGVRDPGECYDDVNGNKMWDADPGLTGQGGASDITLYSVSVSYKRLFPLAALIGWSPTISLSAQTLLKNQPYATQAIPTVQNLCN